MQYQSNSIQISVIVPVYNTMPRLSVCLDSLHKQSMQAIEFILVDDGSTDTSLNTCKQFAKEDQRFIVIHKENAGVSSARNTGLERARGKYIAFVDSDDYIKVNAFEKMLDKMTATHTDLLLCSYYTSYNGHIMEHRGRDKTYPDLHLMEEEFPLLFQDCFFNSPWNKMYIREKINSSFKENINYFEDYLFNLDYMDNINSICVYDECFYYYTEDMQSSLTKKYRQDLFDVFPQIYHRQLEFSHKYFGEQFDGMIANSLLYGIYNSMQKLVYSDCTKKYKLEMINKWSRSKDIIDSLQFDYWEKNNGLQYKVAYTLMKKGYGGALMKLLTVKKRFASIIIEWKRRFRK